MGLDLWSWALRSFKTTGDLYLSYIGSFHQSLKGLYGSYYSLRRIERTRCPMLQCFRNPSMQLPLPDNAPLHTVDFKKPTA